MQAALKGTRVFWITPLIVLLGVALTACSQPATPPSSREDTPAQSAVQAPKQDLTQRDNGQGSVTVEATWVAQSHRRQLPQALLKDLPADQYLLIHLMLDTHSVDLTTYKLASLATLKGRDNVAISPIAWVGMEESSHHREGVLVFDRQSNEVWASREGRAELRLEQIAGVLERTFWWEF